MPDDAKRAVFLSYASQDAEAARRICDALRAAGIVVWFDQSELRGGDAWDANIRSQIGECALFVPIVSAATQARREGYFRLEWKLADERTHLMAEGTPFILPVTIDATTERGALVPKSFLAVQWTKLPGGETPAAFGERVKKLLGGGVAQASPPAVRADAGGTPALPPKVGRRVPATSWMIVILVLAGVSVLVWRKSESTPIPAPNASAGTRPPTAEVLKPSLPPAVIEARQLVAQARPHHEHPEGLTRADYELAEQMFKKALELAPLDAEVWAAYSWFCSNYTGFGFDRSSARVAEVKRAADMAFKLAPDSNWARFAWANYYRRQSETRTEAIRMLRELVDKMPGEAVVLRVLSLALRLEGNYDEALAVLDRAITMPGGGDAHAWLNRETILIEMHRLPEAEAAVDHSLAAHPTPRGLLEKVYFLMFSHGDLEQAGKTLGRVPGEFLADDLGAYLASRLWLWRREPTKSLAALNGFPKDFIEASIYFVGPKGFFVGLALQMDKRPDAARAEWEEALRVLEPKFAARRTNYYINHCKATLLAMTGRRAEAEAAVRTYEQTNGAPAKWMRAQVQLWLGDRDDALKTLEGIASKQNEYFALRYDPMWDPLRGDPRFDEIVMAAKPQ